MFVNKPLETVFYKNNDCVDIVSENYFTSSGDKNIYKVIQCPSLNQKNSGPCGYYALNNILKAHDQNCQITLGCVDRFLNSSLFDSFFDKLLCYNSGNNVLSQLDIADSINNNLKELCQANIMISLESTNNLNCIEDKNIITFSGGGKALDRIRDFQTNGTPQYLIIGTKEEKRDQLKHISGLTLNWDNRDDRLYCVEKHWLALKIEWQDQNRPGACPVILSIFDSSGASDSRFAILIHWYYYIFTHTII